MFISKLFKVAVLSLLIMPAFVQASEKSGDAKDSKQSTWLGSAAKWYGRNKVLVGAATGLVLGSGLAYATAKAAGRPVNCCREGAVMLGLFSSLGSAFAAYNDVLAPVVSGAVLTGACAIFDKNMYSSDRLLAPYAGGLAGWLIHAGGCFNSGMAIGAAAGGLAGYKTGSISTSMVAGALVGATVNGLHNHWQHTRKQLGLDKEEN